ncbi:MAG: DUF6273 domain-containing protein [Clostridium sp.]|nr:DUF6273 domain-containing protein [Clostridium sp.]MCM1172013.1 DUF6273 domain-containing protein [Clostridium sp.]MCM1209363.1 DUF6273 domain-containing protein [Ruminococcus sp.]
MIKIEKLFLFLFFLTVFMAGCDNKVYEYAAMHEEDITKGINYSTEELETVEISQAEPGDIIRMGHYEQDGDEAADDEIFWDVLDKKEDKLLVISHYILARRSFDDENVTWENSQLREWLNSEFYNGAFNDNEKNRIAISIMSNPSSRVFYESEDAEREASNPPFLENMCDTEDNIFLLSWEEVLKYYDFKLVADDDGNKQHVYFYLMARPSYVVTLEHYKGQIESEILWLSSYGLDARAGASTWWLRSEGLHPDRCMYIQQDDIKFSVGYISDQAHFFDAGVRPAMWINIK